MSGGGRRSVTHSGKLLSQIVPPVNGVEQGEAERKESGRGFVDHFGRYPPSGDQSACRAGGFPFGDGGGAAAVAAASTTNATARL